METRRKAAAAAAEGGQAIHWPLVGELNADWVKILVKSLETASRTLAPHELPTVLPIETLETLVERATRLLQLEQNIVEVKPSADQTVTVVGDVHGQLHDVLKLFEDAGEPSETSLFVFNGDYVDRGAWSVETYVILLSWKLLLPKSVVLLRGNHETKFCTMAYGFKQELDTKYMTGGAKLLRKFLACFAAHPLAAIINRAVFIAHGGLFREPPSSHKKHKGKGHSKKASRHKVAAAEDELRAGSIQDLARAKRTALDPLGGANPIPSDILWSDPGLDPGLVDNHARGIGLIFGPDVTQEFLSRSGFKLVIRSHEGPDAREKRAGMASMKTGYAVDHTVPAGRLVTLFSAPDYPQFQPPSQKRLANSAAFLVLRPPDFAEPEVHHFEAVLPRPQVTAYYDVENCLDSDEDLDLPGCSSETEDQRT